MNITRHNYEEYFVLYMDNELSSDDRRMVENFIQNHPDLKEELEVLLQFKLVPDTNIVFAGKEELMNPLPIEMTGNGSVNPANCEEWLVLYADNELSAGQRKAVEHFIAANPSAKKELALIQRSKLQPEKIIFADKKILYRQEEKVRVVPMRWWRIAAAAVLLFGIGISAAVIISKQSYDGGEIVKGITPGEKINIETPGITPEKINNRVNETAVADNTVKQIVLPESKQPLNDKIVVSQKNKKVSDKLPVNMPKEISKDEQVIVKENNDKPSNKLPQPLTNPNLNKKDPFDNTVAGTPLKPTKTLTEPPVTISPEDPSDSKNSDVSFASFEEESKSKKNRGFFRKIARTFEKRTSIDPTDDGKLLVGGLAIKLR